MAFQVNKPIIIAITANPQIAIQKNDTIEAYIIIIETLVFTSLILEQL